MLLVPQAKQDVIFACYRSSSPKLWVSGLEQRGLWRVWGVDAYAAGIMIYESRPSGSQTLPWSSMMT